MIWSHISQKPPGDIRCLCISKVNIDVGILTANLQGRNHPIQLTMTSLTSCKYQYLPSDSKNGPVRFLSYGSISHEFTLLLHLHLGCLIRHHVKMKTRWIEFWHIIHIKNGISDRIPFTFKTELIKNELLVPLILVLGNTNLACVNWFHFWSSRRQQIE